MKTALLAVISAYLTLAPVVSRAGDVVPDFGMPFCTDRSEVQEYILANIKGDAEWVSRLVNCGMLKPGVKIGIIEVYPGDSRFGHIEKIRMFVPDSMASFVGYAMRMTTGETAPKQ
jgi:hypothetical protein